MTNLEKPSPCKADFYALWCDECSVHPSDCPLRAASRPAQEPVAVHWAAQVKMQSAIQQAIMAHPHFSGSATLAYGLAGAARNAILSLTGENEK